MAKMKYNVCPTCGAKDGRAGSLYTNGEGQPLECENCFDTRTTGGIVFHTLLIRTDEERVKTMAILDKGK